MKIYESVTIDMTTLEVIEEESFEYEGPLDLCFGGGGNSGTVGFAGYIEDAHKDIITSASTTAPSTWSGSIKDLYTIIPTMQYSNPFTSASAFDPDVLLSKIQERYEYFDTLIKDMDEHADWDTFHDNVKDKIDQILSDAYIESIVNDYAKSIETDHASIVNRFAGPMSEINAVNSSAFILGMSNIEKDRLRKISAFRSDLVGKFEDTRQKLYDAGMKEMIGLFNLKLSMNNAITGVIKEANATSIIAKKEQYENDLELDKMDVEWDINVLRQATGILGSIGGSQYLPEKPSKVASAASGALAGAVSGAQATGGNPWGIAAGAALGLIGGAAQ